MSQVLWRSSSRILALFLFRTSKDVALVGRQWNTTLSHFQKKHIVPHLTDGWFALVTKLDIQQPTEIHFSYYGSQVFRISLTNILNNTVNFPSFHSLSTNPKLTSYFDIMLTDHDLTNSKLILPQPFAKYLYENDFKTVLLCTEQLDIVQCSVITRGPLQNCVEIAYG
ncbi:hypothetical protein TSUD_150770 [Trifolium subterraneum]|uniref:TF-B3 domain-containing protein n=1 Tax=Trifolium subterraneum TaxID=3900 RepID=A0A2Z6M2L9_TRISU|nr:hypothetical protein TSUD_150770 [Trifolium subterraneum]